MADKTREVGIRLSVKDAEVAKAALAQFGEAGAATLRRIEQAAKPANTSLLALSAGIQRSKEYARDFALEAGRSFLGPVAAISTAAGAVELLRSSIERVQKVAQEGDLADRIGIAIDKLQGLQATFRESGNDVEELNGAVQTFTSNLAKAGAQGGPLAAIFNANGLKITGDTFTDLQHYADLVKNARNEQDRLYLVTTAFGRSSKELNDLLVNGGDGLGHAADEAHRLGTALDSMDVQKARDATKELAEVSLKLDAAQEKFGLLIEPGEIATLELFNGVLAKISGSLTDIQNHDFGALFKLPTPTTGKGYVLDDFEAWAEQQLGALWGPGPHTLQEVLDNQKGAPATPHVKADSKSSPLSPTDFPNSGVGYSPPALKATVLPDKDAAAAVAQIKKVSDALKLQIANLTETNRQQAINNELAKASVSATSEQGRSIANLAGELYDQKQQLQAVNDATTFLAQTGESVFEDMVDGTKSWTDELGDLLKTLLKVGLQAELLGTGPLAGILGTQSQTTGQPGGWLGSLISGFFGGGSAAPAGGEIGGFGTSYANAKGNAFSSHSSLHDFVNTVATHPTAFRFARGAGLMGEEASSPGEAIMPLARDPRTGKLGVSGQGGGAIKVSVQIVRMPGQGADAATASQRGNQVDVKAMIYDAVAEGAVTRGNPINRALGMRNKLTSR